MKKKNTTTVIKTFRWGAFLFLLLLLGLHVMPRALGQPQRVISKKTFRRAIPSRKRGRGR